MGYTHYFAYQPTDPLFVERWPQLVSDAAMIAAHAHGTLHIATDNDISESGLSINGAARGNLAGGPLKLNPDPWDSWEEEASRGHTRWAAERRAEYERNDCMIDFCPTGRRPYDAVAAAILLRAQHLLPDAVKIASDGAWEREWFLGAATAEEPNSTREPQQSSAVGIVAELFEQTYTAESLVLCRGEDVERVGVRAVRREPATTLERAALAAARSIDEHAESLPGQPGTIVLAVSSAAVARIKRKIPAAVASLDPDVSSRSRLVLADH